MGIEASVDAPSDGSALHQRAWPDLDPWRLGLALAVAPVPPILLCGLSALGSGPSLDFIAGPWVPPLHFIVMAVFGEFWSVAFGAIYLWTSPRRSGAITRGNCLFVGGLTAVLFVPLLTLIFGAAVGVAAANLLMMALPFSMLGGLLLSPLGLLGGWVFWLIGVKPAQARPLGIEPVFD
jgi:hypothetical protein